MKNTAFLTIVTLFVTLVALSSCSTELQEVKLLSQLKPVLNENKECRQAIKANPDYARIYEKLALEDPNIDPTSKQLADTTKPSDEDIALGLDWYAEYENCERETIEQVVSIVPEFGEITIDLEQRRTKLVDEIVNHKPTYGHINHEILAIRIYAKEAGKQVAHSLQERLKEQAEERAEGQQEAIDTVSSIILDMVSALGHQQGALSHSQHLFAASHHFYKPTHLITETKCHYVGKIFTCTQ